MSRAPRGTRGMTESERQERLLARRRSESTTIARLAAAVNAPLDEAGEAEVAENLMQAAEAQADRQGTRRDEERKAQARREAELPAAVAMAQRRQRAAEEGRTVASFCKLKREPGQPWGVRVPLPSNQANPGCVVTVRTQAGKESQIRLGSEVATFDDAALFTIAEEVDRVASPGQIEYITDLLPKVDISDEQRAEAERQLAAGLTFAKASQWLDSLVELPRRGVAAEYPELTSDVPAGRYAIDSVDGDNAVSFYRVERPDRGRYAGRIFVTLHTGGGDQSLNAGHAQSVLDRIAEAGPAEASRRYGIELGHCGVCGRELTNDTSRERGIGPKCAARLGW